MIIKSLDHLRLISSKIAENASEKDCLFLKGEIGVGKTTFTRNFINYLQKKNEIKVTDVLSPTFNLLYEYEIKNFKVKHYDLYRIKKSKELDELGIFKENFDSIKIIEWPELVETKVTNRLEIYLDYSNKDQERKIRLLGYGKWKGSNENKL